MNMVLKSLLLSSMVMSVMASANIVIPDIFGAYQRGAEQARAANQRDAYYYQNHRPSVPVSLFKMSVRERKSDGKYGDKNRMQLSLKNKDILCWGVSGLENNMVYSATEIFGVPFETSKMDRYVGNTSVDNGRAIVNDMKVLDNNTYAFDRQMTAKGSISTSCWTFKTETSTGIYTLRVVFGGVDFGAHRFEIVK
ncbi:hypothetical protein [Moraxella ovis]|uniref:hypothetical protein n=1 Tax=Moraxella ovis TaxID=29433 RepID=UPI000DA0A5D6|nr:hypothetical protein [Moraxella ovis]SPX85396.1 Uncharacterised protein [Moraxella ovis]STZ06301.1 Uncharacterised protein [Moraxella ovis]